MTTISGTPRYHSVAPLKNVAAMMTLVQTLQDRPRGLPGLGVGYGPAGFGKTIAAQYVQNRLSAHYIEYRSFWTARTFCQQLLMELGGRPRGTIADMMGEIIDRIGDDQTRPLIIDEADKLVDRGNIELVRDIYETTGTPIVLVGEERLPEKLQPFERVYDRVLLDCWVPFQPCDDEDTRALANLLCRNLKVADDLISAIRTETGGRARRIATTLHAVASFARNEGISEVTLGTYRGRISNGEAPKRLSRVV